MQVSALFCRKSLLTASLAVAFAFGATGCANFATTASYQDSFAKAGTIGGTIFGGNQPVSGAAVTVYTVGTTGYGSAGTTLATTTSGTGGGFTFTQGLGNGATNDFTCPSGDPQVYVTAVGGDTQGAGNGANSAAVFIAALGDCNSTANEFVNLNEITTVGTMAALQQYFNPTTETLGYANTTLSATGYTNGLATVGNLVNTATGAVNTGSTSVATPSGSTSSATVTILPEVSKIDTIANITAACVNTTSNASGNCTALFNNATPPTMAVTSQPNATAFVTATDVLQATYFMLTNPTDGSATKLNNLYSLAPAASPFQPTLATAPTDWTIAIRYSSTSACTYGTLLLAPYELAVDGSGNLWIAAGGTSTASSNLVELGTAGKPLYCGLGASVGLTKGLTIDTGGSIWIAGNAANDPFYKVNATAYTSVPFAVPTGRVPYAVAADGSGNIFYTDATNKVVDEFAGVAASATAKAALNIATVGSSPFFITPDPQGNVFVPQSATTNVLYDVYPGTGTGNTNGYLTTNVGSATNVVNPYAFAAGLNGTIFGGNSTSASSTVSQTEYAFTPSGAGTVTFTTNSAQYAGGIGSPRGPAAVDGAGNVWYADSLGTTGNYVTGATTGGNNSVSEFSAAGVALSPSSTVSGADNAGFQKDSTIFTSGPRAAAVDLTGNVWFGSNSSTGNGVVELVGAGVPVVTPVSAGLAAAIAAGNKNAVQMP